MLNITRKRMISYDTDIQNTPEKAHNSDLIKIGISQGDTNGVGYELILKTFSDPGMLELCTPCRGPEVAY